MTLIFNPPIIAHRGASAYAPENTMAAFTKAVQMGASWIEFDVTLSKDRVPVIFHDKYLKRISGKPFRPCDYTFAELMAQDAGSWFDPRFASERIVSLDQALGFLKEMHLSANVEIKQMPGCEEMAIDAIVPLVASYFPEADKNILFSSFSIKLLKHLRQYSPDCHMGLLLHKWKSGWQTLAEDLRCVSVHVNQAVLTQERARQIKQSHRTLLAYTVNDKSLAQTLFDWGVDAVFSDFPDLLSS